MTCKDCKNCKYDKLHPIMEICGDLDELSCTLGLARSKVLWSPHDVRISIMQAYIYKLCGLLAEERQEEADSFWIKRLDIYMSRYKEHQKAEIHDFIISGNNEISTLLDVARTVTRRCERTILKHKKYITNNLILDWINKLSQLLYIMARSFDTNLTTVKEILNGRSLQHKVTEKDNNVGSKTDIL